MRIFSLDFLTLLTNIQLSSSNSPERLVTLDLLIDKLDKVHNATAFPLRFRRNHLARIHILPDEILLTIFRCWWDERIEKCHGYAMGKQLLLSWVCQRWRTLVQNDPAFWTYIDNRGPTDALRENVQRSKNAGLHVKLIRIEQQPKGQEKIIADIILGEAHRIETLRALRARRSLWKNIVDNLEIATSRLRYITLSHFELELELESCPGTSIDLKLFINQLTGPTLWSAFNGNAFMSTIRQLRMVTLEQFANSRGFGLDLSQCSQLQALDLQWSPLLYLKLWNFTYATLGQLHTLVLHRDSNLEFLDYVQLPKLRRLVCDFDPHSPSQFEKIKKHITFSRIRRLGIGSQDVDGHGSGSIFQIDGSSEDPGAALTCCGTGFAHHSSLSPEHQNHSQFQFCFKAGTEFSVDELIESVTFDRILVEATNVDKVIIHNASDESCNLESFFAKFIHRPCLSLALHEVINTADFLKKLCDNNICCGLEEFALSSVTEKLMSLDLGDQVLQLAKARQEKGSPIKRIHIKHLSLFSPVTFFSNDIVTGLTELGVELVETTANNIVCTIDLPYWLLTRCFFFFFFLRKPESVLSAPVPVLVVCEKNGLISGFRRKMAAQRMSLKTPARTLMALALNGSE
ncbi:MAG TPA: hypothetical protein VGO47_03670 [Chlamydiales bacterium]|nr:hypothetical protein [Chlamydiales bacterium]